MTQQSTHLTQRNMLKKAATPKMNYLVIRKKGTRP